MPMATLIQEKVRQAVAILRERDVDCWLTFARETQLNGDPTLPFLVDAALTWHSALIVCASGRTTAIVGAYDQKTVEETGAYDEVIGYVEGIRTQLLATLQAIAPRSIAVNYSRDSEVCDGLTHGMYLTLFAMLTEIGYQDRLISAERIVSALRQRKTPSELARLRAAIRAAEGIFGNVAGFIRPGHTEREIAAFMQTEARSSGLALAWEPKTCPSVFSGPKTAGAHYAPTERTVARGHVLNMDFGVRVDGYCSDLQRTFYVREAGARDVPPEVRNGFDTIVLAIELARRALKPGVQGHTIDAIARGVLAEAGYEAFPHGLGHQVGRSAHDGTALLGPAWEKYAGKPFEPIESGMVFTIEPRLTVAGRGVVTIEEMVVVTDEGAEYLSTPQKELWLVG
jgi:Xaa-Pro aminopeptidase